MPRPLPSHPSSELMLKAEAVKGRSLLADATRRLMRNKAAVAGMIVLGMVTLLAVFAPFLSPYAFSDTDSTTPGTYEFYVAPFETTNSDEGLESNHVTVVIPDVQPPAKAAGAIAHGELRRSREFCERVVNLPLFYGIREDGREAAVAALSSIV
mgnify:CR=1 FL=1